MLTDGVNHVAVLTDDPDRFKAFYTEVFDAEVEGTFAAGPGMTLHFVRIGPHTELNVFHVARWRTAAPRRRLRAGTHRPPRDPGGVAGRVRDHP